MRVFRCGGCGFEVPRDVNAVLNFLKIYEKDTYEKFREYVLNQYALWQGLRGVAALSIVRRTVSPVTGGNRRALERACVLKYQDARGL